MSYIDVEGQMFAIDESVDKKHNNRVLARLAAVAAITVTSCTGPIRPIESVGPIATPTKTTEVISPTDTIEPTETLVRPTEVSTIVPEVVRELNPSFVLEGVGGYGGPPSEENKERINELWVKWKPYVEKLVEIGYVSGVVGGYDTTGLQMTVGICKNGPILYGRIEDPNSTLDKTVIYPDGARFVPNGLVLEDMRVDWNKDSLVELKPEVGNRVVWHTELNTFVEYNAEGLIARRWNGKDSVWVEMANISGAEAIDVMSWPQEMYDIATQLLEASDEDKQKLAAWINEKRMTFLGDEYVEGRVVWEQVLDKLIKDGMEPSLVLTPEELDKIAGSVYLLPEYQTVEHPDPELKFNRVYVQDDGADTGYGVVRATRTATPENIDLRDNWCRYLEFVGRDDECEIDSWVDYAFYKLGGVIVGSSPIFIRNNVDREFSNVYNIIQVPKNDGSFAYSVTRVAGSLEISIANSRMIGEVADVPGIETKRFIPPEGSNRVADYLVSVLPNQNTIRDLLSISTNSVWEGRYVGTQKLPGSQLYERHRGKPVIFYSPKYQMFDSCRVPFVYIAFVLSP